MKSPEYLHNKEALSISVEYSKILNSSIAPENIDSFCDHALEQLITLTEKTVKQYQMKHPENSFQGKVLEDVAQQEAGLQNIESVLTAIHQRQELLNTLKNFIGETLDVSKEVFVPPSPEERYTIQKGSGRGIEAKNLIPRLLTFLYILENDLDIPVVTDDEEGAVITKGTVTDSMMRTEPYIKITIEALKRVVYLCEEEGNATFIFDQEKVDAFKLSPEFLDRTDKASFNELFKQHPDLGTRLVYGTHWRGEVISALTEDFTAELKTEKEVKVKKPKSDFAERVEVSQKKEGWESAHSLSDSEKVDAAPKTINKYTETFRAHHSEWFELQRNNVWRGRATEHYHPELIRLIKEHFSAIPQRREGWKTASSLMNEVVVPVTHTTIKKYVAQFRESNPKWFEIQKTDIGKNAEYYHPDLVALIKEHFSAIPQKKEGWETSNNLQEAGIAHATIIKKFVELYRTEHPEWFEIQKINGQISECYHPDLVHVIREKLEVSRAKDGWRTVQSLLNTLHAGYQNIMVYAEQFKNEHPEWFEMQKVRGGKVAIHYHPELVDLLQKHFIGEESIPNKKSGWANASLLKNESSTAVVTIKKYVEQYRVGHPDWFEMQRSTNGHVTEHYHPALVVLINGHFPKRTE